MAYLSKAERYDDILKTAMNILVEEGIASITARKVAGQANMAVGQIHHHFKSIGQLKAQALIGVTEKLVARAGQHHANEPITNKIIRAVGPVEGKEGVLIRKLWNEAYFLAERDTDIKQACKQSTEEWHKVVVKLIKEAVDAKEISTDDISGLAWRLIAFSCGIDSLSTVDELALSNEAIKQHIIALLK